MSPIVPAARARRVGFPGLVSACSAALSMLPLQGGPTSPGPAAGLAPFRMTLPGGLVEFEMVGLPAGELARAGGAQRVGPFWMSATEITWDAYDVFVFRLDLPEAQREGEVDGVTRPTKPYMLADRGFGHAGYPAISLSPKGAEAFCRWLSAATGRRVRLPTEAEWEWAARAGSASALSCGDEAGLAEIDWFRDNAERKTHPVGKKKKNAFGLHDMHGNVAEWATLEGGRPVACGGSFRDPAAGCGASARREPTPAWNAGDPQVPKSTWWLTEGAFVGFRVVCEPEPRSEAK